MIILLIDYHIHSTFSCDSISTIDEICQAAISRGISEIAITDHMDYMYPNQLDDHYIQDVDGYIEAIAYHREKYKSELIVKTGIEIGLDIHRLNDYDTLLNKYPFDFVIGSVHGIDGIEVHTPPFYQGKSKEEAYQKYYETILHFIEHYNNFDVIGHLDYCKRYMPDE